MPTPNFKLLANSLRLGQPPEPTAAIRTLVEVIQHQESELAELRARVGMLLSRLQFSEAQIARMEATGISIPSPAPTRPGVEDLRMEEDSSDGFGSTLSVRRVDIDAVVQRVVAQEPYPMAPAGTHRPHETTGMPFSRATALPLIIPKRLPSPAADLASTFKAAPFPQSPGSLADLSQTAEVAAADPKLESFADDASCDETQMTNILKRRPE